MAKENQAKTTKVVTDLVRFSYAHLFEPKSIDGSEPKYSMAVLIPKNDKKTLKKIKNAVDAAIEAGKTKLADKKGNVPTNIKTPLRDGDEERPDQEEYEGMYFLNATSKAKPGVVDKNLNEVLSSEEVYSGCWGRVSLNFYAFNTNGNKGIGAGLNNVQKVKDDDYLGGRSRAEDDFDEWEDDEDEEEESFLS
jgi:hypothetical protein